MFSPQRRAIRLRVVARLRRPLWSSSPRAAGSGSPGRTARRQRARRARRPTRRRGRATLSPRGARGAKRGLAGPRNGERAAVTQSLAFGTFLGAPKTTPDVTTLSDARGQIGTLVSNLASGQMSRRHLHARRCTHTPPLVQRGRVASPSRPRPCTRLTGRQPAAKEKTRTESFAFPQRGQNHDVDS